MTVPSIKEFSLLENTANTALFMEKRMDYDGSNNLIYIGYNKKPNAPTAESSWYIVKLTYSGSNVTRYQLPDTGAKFGYDWDNRTTFFT